VDIFNFDIVNQEMIGGLVVVSYSFHYNMLDFSYTSPKTKNINLWPFYKKIDDYILLKLKETREHFFFNEVMEILIEYKVVSYENRNKLKIKFLTTLESILTDDEKLLFARYYPFAQFELKVYRYFIKEIETLNILLKLPKDQGIDFLMDFNEQDKEIYKYLRDRDHINKKNDIKAK
jgi:hypothetical protein